MAQPTLQAWRPPARGRCPCTRPIRSLNCNDRRHAWVLVGVFSWFAHCTTCAAQELTVHFESGPREPSRDVQEFRRDPPRSSASAHGSRIKASVNNREREPRDRVLKLPSGTARLWDAVRRGAGCRIADRHFAPLLKQLFGDLRAPK